MIVIQFIEIYFVIIYFEYCKYLNVFLLRKQMCTKDAIFCGTHCCIRKPFAFMPITLLVYVRNCANAQIMV